MFFFLISTGIFGAAGSLVKDSKHAWSLFQLISAETIILEAKKAANGIFI